MRCKFCQRILNGGISRLKHHISRLLSKGVNPCSKVRDDVTDKVRTIIAARDEIKETPSSKKQKLVKIKSPGTGNVSASKPLTSLDTPTTPIQKVFPNVTPVVLSGPSPLNSHENAERSIALFFFENKLDFSIARSSSYQLMIDAITKCGPEFVGPSPETLNTTWPESIKSEMSLQSKDSEKEWTTTGCTIIADTRTDNKSRALISFLVSSPSRTFFSQVDWVNRCILQAQTISKFIYDNALMLDLMKKFSGGQELIRTGTTKSVSNFLSLQSILKQRSRKWRDQLHSSLHAAAAFLNPGIQYNPEIKFLTSIKEDFFKVLEKLLPAPETRRDITSQIFTVTKATGMFGCSLAMEARDAVSPGLWWEQYGDAAPVLQRVAIRILSQVCSTFTFERHWSAFQQIHSEKRNKIDREILNDLVYINYNLKLTRQTRTKALEADPIQLDDIDMTSEWVEESDNPNPTQWLDRFGSALDVSDLNTRQLVLPFLVQTTTSLVYDC
ncbi:unnamed protein product [Malus baccata var. baccata]